MGFGCRVNPNVGIVIPHLRDEPAEVAEVNDASLNSCIVLKGRVEMGGLFGVVRVGQQPPRLVDTLGRLVQSVDDRYTILWDGVLFDIVSLASKLDSATVEVAHARREPQLVLEAWAKWGPSCVELLDGAFIFGLLDHAKGQLYLVRDRFGTRSLYYVRRSGYIAFSSRISTLFERTDVSHKVNPRQIYAYLRYGLINHYGETLFREISQVPPGHYGTFDAQTCSQLGLIDYWQLRAPSIKDRSFTEAAREMRQNMLETVSARLGDDRVVASLLSGGIDSSSIVGVLRHIRPDIELHTFSYVPDDGRISEEAYVDTVVAATGAISHKIGIHANELSEDIKSLIRHHGVPLSGSSIYAQYRMFRAAKDAGFSTIFDGQGADEILAGNLSFIVDRFVSLLSEKDWGQVWTFYKAVSHSAPPLWLAMRIASHLLPDALYPLALNVGDQGFFPQWMNEQWFLENGVGFPRRHARYAPGHFYEQIIREIRVSTLPTLLRHIEHNAASLGLNVILPFLSLELTRLTLSLPPSELYTNDGLVKAPLRAAMRGLVPEAVLLRRDKIGFATPEQKWLRSGVAWVGRQLTDAILLENPALRAGRVLDEWAQIRDAGRPMNERIWRWINLKLWTEIFDVEF